MKVLSDLRREMNLQDVVAAELLTSNKLLPPRWGDRALVGSEGDVESWLTSITRREIMLDPEEVLLARKLGRGARPLAILGLKERLLYRGAVSLVESEVGSPSRTQEAYEAFQAKPLENDDCAYVLKTDIASYYQYVDHERLVDEVVAQTGDDLPITMAVEVLHEVTARRFGIPQLSAVSDTLAEVYIDPMRRDLVRGGFRVARFADDFRIACRNYDEALVALEATDHAARELGLVLNEAKTSTPKRERYLSSLTATQDRERDLFAQLEIDELEEPDPDFYTDAWDLDEPELPESLLDEAAFDEGEVGPSREDEEEETVSPTQLAAAMKVVDLWIEEEEEDEVQRGEPAQITAALLGRALRVFTRAGDPSALENVAMMLVYEPSLTPTIARYLRGCGRTERLAVRDVLDDVCQSRIVGAWQALWIAYVAGELPRRRPGKELPHIAWLRDQIRRAHPIVSAEALLALSRRKLISSDDVLDVIRQLPNIHRSTGLLALSALGEEEAALAAADSELDRIRVRWGLEYF